MLPSPQLIKENVKVYPVSRYGIERLQLANISIHSFNHLDTNHLLHLPKNLYLLLKQ